MILVGRSGRRRNEKPKNGGEGRRKRLKQPVSKPNIG
jgi:hypothetical protein